MKFTKILATGTLAGAIVLGTATSAFAWRTNQSATAACNPNGPGVVVTALFVNTEPAGHPELNMKVSATFEGKPMAVTSVDDIAESGGRDVRFELKLEEYNDLLPGRVEFKLTWADGHRGTDVRYATTNPVSGCKDIMLPGVEWSASQPVCGDETFVVTIIAGDGNEPTNVELVALPDTVLFSKPLQPNSTETITVPIATGGTVTLQLLQDGTLHSEQAITAPSEAACHVPAPSATFNGGVNCEERVNGTITINRDGMEGNFRAIVNGDEVIIEDNTYEVAQATQPLDIHVFAPNGAELEVSAAMVGAPDNCDNHEPTPTTQPPAPKPSVPPTPPITELAYTGSNTPWMIGIAGLMLLLGIPAVRKFGFRRAVV